MTGAVAYALGGLAACVLLVLLVRSRIRSDEKNRRGCEPGQGDQIIDMGYYAGGPGGGHGGAIRVTRDPQAYARGMAPKR